MLSKTKVLDIVEQELSHIDVVDYEELADTIVERLDEEGLFGGGSDDLENM